jgi:hypothetical protein
MLSLLNKAKMWVLRTRSKTNSSRVCIDMMEINYLRSELRFWVQDRKKTQKKYGVNMSELERHHRHIYDAYVYRNREILDRLRVEYERNK